MGEEKVLVVFNEPNPPYRAGETAGFDKDFAEKLCKAGRARPFNPDGTKEEKEIAERKERRDGARALDRAVKKKKAKAKKKEAKAALEEEAAEATETSDKADTEESSTPRRRRRSSSE